MKRIVTNLVKFDELKRNPCGEWHKYFDENGIANAHTAFIKENAYPYDWLYENTNIDLVRWELENNCFDWEKNSWAVVLYCLDKFDPEKFNWEKYSYCIAKYCPDKIDPDKYNWEKDSWAITKYCPDKIDPKKFNWKRNIWTIISNSLDLIIENSDKINWKEIRSHYSYHERRKMLKYIRKLLGIPKGVRNEMSIKFRRLLLSC
jgi:hypothetical protein